MPLPVIKSLGGAPMSDTIRLGKWKYEDVEPEMRSFAHRLQVDYQERRPLSFLPMDCARRALAAMGSSFREVADLSSFHYQTVAGWFRPGRNPTRSVVVDSLFPALCEAYVRRREPARQRQSVARYRYVEEGSGLDDGLRLETERHVASLLCTGADLTPEERTREETESRRGYYQALLRFAASYLDSEELADAAHCVLSQLSRHARRPSQRSSPDELTEFIESIGWALWLEMSDELELLKTGGGSGDAMPYREASVQLGAALIADAADRKRVREMDSLEFDFARSLIIDYESFHNEDGKIMRGESGTMRLPNTSQTSVQHPSDHL